MHYDSVTLRQLDCFRHLLRNGNIRETSSELMIIESGANRLIRQLEIRVGSRLFDRKDGRYQPNERAKALAETALRVTQTFDEIQRFAKNQSSLQHPSLKVGAFTSLAPVVLPRILAAIRKRYQNLKVSVNEAKQDVLEEGTVNGEYDFAFVILPTLTASLDAEILGTFGLACVLPKDHRLTALPVITPHDLADESFISIHRFTPVRAMYDALFDRDKTPRKLNIEARSSGMICAMVSRGLGVSLVSRLTANAWSNHLAVRRFEPHDTVDVGLLRAHTSPSSAVKREFVDAARLVVSELEQRDRAFAARS